LAVNDLLKKRIQELGEAINHSLSQSDPIAAAIGKIKSEGYDVFLVLEATVGFTRRKKADEESETMKSAVNGADLKVRITPHDLEFLKAMRIDLES
jgi:hypothetical protein